MDARTKALKPRRRRSSRRASKPVAKAPRDPDAALVRQLAAELQRGDANAERLRAVLRAALAERRGPTLAEMLDAAPDISGPEFDHIFEEIERFRHHPVMMKVRDVDL
jgi:hypothetical protein